MEPFVGDALPRGDLLAMARDSYARFGHPAVTPLVQIDSDLWVLELFHGPTLAFKDVAMQLLARLMDRVLAASEASGQPSSAPPPGDTGGAAIEAFRGSKRIDAIILFPNGRVSDVQRRMMTTAREPNVHAVEIDGTFDDCQALAEGHVQRPGLSRPRQARRRQFHQLGARGGADRLLLRGRHRARRPAPTRCRSSCRPATSATSWPATRRAAWGCRSSS